MPTMDFTELQRTFRRINPHVLDMFRWRLGWVLSSFPPLTGKIMLLTHTGRRSGRRMRVPVNYAVIDGEVWVTTNQAAQWLRNIRAHPEVEVWLPLRRPRHGVAETMPLDAGHLDQYRRILRNSGFAAARYGGLSRRDSDDVLLAKGAEYHLLRIRRGAVVPRGARAPWRSP